MTHRRAAPAESVYVLLHDIWVNTSLLHALLEERSDVDTLTTGQNLLAAEEEIIVWRSSSIAIVSNVLKLGARDHSQGSQSQAWCRTAALR